ncbi:hypothetical protein T06_10953 [Trichinella sp. T6]|nr:hypothetical protein T06_10953 [Trichinella sp. T6]
MFQYLHPYINSRLLASANLPQRHGWYNVRILNLLELNLEYCGNTSNFRLTNGTNANVTF